VIDAIAAYQNWYRSEYGVHPCPCPALYVDGNVVHAVPCIHRDGHVGDCAPVQQWRLLHECDQFGCTRIAGDLIARRMTRDPEHGELVEAAIEWAEWVESTNVAPGPRTARLYAAASRMRSDETGVGQ
jgi:hypothetical protein